MPGWRYIPAYVCCSLWHVKLPSGLHISETPTWLYIPPSTAPFHWNPSPMGWDELSYIHGISLHAVFPILSRFYNIFFKVLQSLPIKTSCSHRRGYSLKSCLWNKIQTCKAVTLCTPSAESFIIQKAKTPLLCDSDDAVLKMCGFPVWVGLLAKWPQSWRRQGLCLSWQPHCSSRNQHLCMLLDFLFRNSISAVFHFAVLWGSIVR